MIWAPVESDKPVMLTLYFITVSLDVVLKEVYPFGVVFGDGISNPIVVIYMSKVGFIK
jgi:hypothetical protein